MSKTGILVVCVLLIFTGSAIAQQEDIHTILLDVTCTELPASDVIDAIFAVLDDARFTVLPADTPGAEAPTLLITLDSDCNSLAGTVRLMDIVYEVPSPLIRPTSSRQIPIISAETVLDMAHYAVNDCTTAFANDDGTYPFFEANCALQSGDFAAAITLYEQLPQGDLAAATNLSWAYLQSGAPEQAFNVMDSAVASLTDVENEYNATRLVEALAAAGAIRALAFDFDTAIAYLTRAIETAEAYALPPSLIAELYRQRGDHIFLIYEWDRVLTDYNRAIELDSSDADAYFARGVLYYTQGPRPLALADFETFLALAPIDARRAEAEGYIESIEVELDALGGDDVEAFPPGG